MTRYFSLQIPAGIEKAMLPVEYVWPADDFRGAAPVSETSRSAAALEDVLVAQAS